MRALVRSGSRSDRRPRAVPRTTAVRERAVCLGCGAVYAHKAWRRPARPRAAPPEVGPVRCPACRARPDGPGSGRVRLEGAFVAAHAGELRRRIDNVAARASFTQPERRVLDVVRRGSGLEVLTNSQELAHRIAHELAKAFRGDVIYRWSDRGGRLLATWRRD